MRDAEKAAPSLIESPSYESFGNEHRLHGLDSAVAGFIFDAQKTHRQNTDTTKDDRPIFGLPCGCESHKLLLGAFVTLPR